MFYAIVHDEMLPAVGNRRVTVLAPGENEAGCSECQKTIKYDGNFDIVAAFCCKEHYEAGKRAFLPKLPKYTPTVSDKPDKPEKCPSCNGLNKRGGHDDDCPGLSVNKAKVKAVREPCPSCDGPPALRRGWKHKDDCPSLPANKAKVKAETTANRPPCPHCGGPAANRRGWQHKEDCNRGLPPKKASEPCPGCGGLKRGRGYTHKDGCSVHANC